jgi:hypothetical protein
MNREVAVPIEPVEIHVDISSAGILAVDALAGASGLSKTENQAGHEQGRGLA